MFPSGLGVPCVLYLPSYPSLLVSLFQSHAVLADDDSQQIYIFDRHLTERQVVFGDFDFA